MNFTSFRIEIACIEVDLRLSRRQKFFRESFLLLSQEYTT